MEDEGSERDIREMVYRKSPAQSQAMWLKGIYLLTRRFAMANQHVVPHNGGWAVRGEGNYRVTSQHDTQASAIGAGVQIAKNQSSELLIHGQNGQIRARNSYGNDPFPPKG